MRIILKALAWLVGISLAIAVALVVTAVVAYHRHLVSRAEQDRLARERHAAEIRGLAYVDPAGRCGWCGGVHEQHPAIYHAVSVVERVQQVAA